jgi:hypothetical protein
LIGSQYDGLLGGDGDLGGRTWLKGVGPWVLLSSFFLFLSLSLSLPPVSYEVSIIAPAMVFSLYTDPEAMELSDHWQKPLKL